MTLRFYNTLSRQIEPFAPLHPPKVTMYNCGPTVYDHVHIGNIRAFVFADVLRRVLTALGFNVEQVMNITDVDDKTIRGSQAAGVSLNEFTRKYEEVFFSDIQKMNILRPAITPRATEHIPEMIALIQTLLAKNIAYRADDGVYFSVAKAERYGALAQLAKSEGTKSRMRNDEYDKEEAQDFALWKFYTPDDGDVCWEAAFGKGRPGWHIECSAMSMKYLGETIDIHTGGIDLVFPHHTNEKAQSEGVTGKQFVRFWMHNGFINVDNEKMAKSKKNFFILPDIEEHGVVPLAYRYWLLTAHYRTQMNFTWEAVRGAEEALARIKRQLHELGEEFGTPSGEFIERFNNVLSDDLNTAQAIALLWELLKDPSLSGADKRATAAQMDEVLGLNLLDYEQEEIIPTPELATLLEKRKAAREAKDWATADKLRDKIRILGFEVKDTAEGQRLEQIPQGRTSQS